MGASGWRGVHIPLSRGLRHQSLIEQPEQIRISIQELQSKRNEVANIIRTRADALDMATLYQFSDGTLILLARPAQAEQQKILDDLCAELKAMLGPGLCEYHDLARDAYIYHKLADQRFVAMRRIEAYRDMADTNRVRSIAVRRTRREEACILIVEDDRFTASYTANILNRDYEVIHAKTGEEAISAYIDHAPDMVLLDIHLPGLSGHETLQALRKIDADAYVAMLSVDTVRDNIVEAMNAGAAGFLKKPFSKERLLAAVQKSPFIRQPLRR